MICLNANVSVLTAWANDYDYDSAFARQVEAHGKAGGVCWGISTSGNSPNVAQALQTAQEMKMKTIALTGEGGGETCGSGRFADFRPIQKYSTNPGTAPTDLSLRV